jgi:hypothetical protein
MRLRNESDQPRELRPGGRQIYLNVGGTRVRSLTAPPTPAPVKEGFNTQLRFRLQGGVAERIAQADFLELAVVPWREAGREKPSRIGVIRFPPPGGGGDDEPTA